MSDYYCTFFRAVFVLFKIKNLRTFESSFKLLEKFSTGFGILEKFI